MQPAPQTQQQLHSSIMPHLPSSPKVWHLLHSLQNLIWKLCQNCQNANRQINIQYIIEHVSQYVHEQTQDAYSKADREGAVLRQPKYADVGNLFQIIMPVVGFYIRLWQVQWVFVINNQADGHQEIGEAEELTQLAHGVNCLCGGTADGEQFCYRCGGRYHSCWGPMGQLFECSGCYLKYCLPDRQVVKVLFKGYLPPVTQNNPLVSLIQLQPLQPYPKYSIQLRCTQIGSYTQSWPSSCDIYLDQTLSVSYRPLPKTSPLKHRYDNPIVISIKDYGNSQKIWIKEEGTPRGWYMVCILAVVDRTQQQLYSSYLHNAFYQLPIPYSKSNITKHFTSDPHIQINQLRISPVCQFYRCPISTPIRSRLCTSHLQPFDLYNFICASVKAKNSIKRWMCPVCGQRAYDLVRDPYLGTVIANGGMLTN